MSSIQLTKWALKRRKEVVYWGLTHLLRITCDGVPKLSSRLYQFHLTKFDPINTGHFIPIKEILYSNCLVRKSDDVYLTIKCGYVYIDYLGSVRITLMRIYRDGLKVHIYRNYRHTSSYRLKMHQPMAPLAMTLPTPLHPLPTILSLNSLPNLAYR